MHYTAAMNRRLTRISKYLSFVLKHHPESIGLTLDGDRWAVVEDLVTKANESGKTVTSDHITQIIQQSEEKRFEMSDDAIRIRAI